MIQIENSTSYWSLQPFFCQCSLRRTESDDIPRSPASVEAWRVIKSIAISLGAYSLKQMSKKSWLASIWVCIVSGAAILSRLHSQAGTLAPHNLASPPHFQCRWAANVQVHLTRSNTTTYSTPNRFHGNWQIEAINQAHIIEMQWWSWWSKCHFDHSCWRNSPSSLAMQLAKTIPCFAVSFSITVKGATLSAPYSSWPFFRHIKNYFFAAAKMETATLGGGYACTSKYSRPYAFIAVVY